MDRDRNDGRMRAKMIYSFTHQGERPAQEDHLLLDRERGVFVVADGFGGPTAGTAASKTACESVRNFLYKEAGDKDATLPFVLRSYYSLVGNVLFNSLVHANRSLLALNQGKNVHERGGASVLACYLDGNLLAVASAGVCTAWLMRSGKSIELVLAKTWGRLLDPFSAERKRDYQAPLMALGISEDLEPEVVEYRIQPNDWLIIQSDGLSVELKDKILDFQGKNLPHDQIVSEVAAVLNQGRFSDNCVISLIIF